MTLMHTNQAVASVAIARGRAVILDADGKLAYPVVDGGNLFGIVSGAVKEAAIGSVYVLGEIPNAEVGAAVAKGDLLRASKTTGKLVKAAASVLMDSDNANSDVTFTANRSYHGSKGEKISVTFTDPTGNNQPLTITVSNLDIDVSLKTGGAGAIESTAAEIVAAILADATAKHMVTGVADGTGAGVVKAIAKSYLYGGHGAFARANEDGSADGNLVAAEIFGGEI